jgi:hypothetical protein
MPFWTGDKKDSEVGLGTYDTLELKMYIEDPKSAAAGSGVRYKLGVVH